MLKNNVRVQWYRNLCRELGDKFKVDPLKCRSDTSVRSNVWKVDV